MATVPQLAQGQVDLRRSHLEADSGPPLGVGNNRQKQVIGVGPGIPHTGCLLLRRLAQALGGTARLHPLLREGIEEQAFVQAMGPQEVTQLFQQMRYMRAVPTGRARKELYQMAMEGYPTVRCFYSSLMNLVWHASATLGTWELAQAAQIDKQNGKQGTAGIRLIMMLDPLGKAYYWMMHQRTSELKTPFGYGFYAKRRREQAILVHHAVVGRLLSAMQMHGSSITKKSLTVGSLLPKLRQKCPNCTK